MKEASGELSMTAVAVVAIAAIAIVFTTLVWPSIQGGIQRATWCSNAFNCRCNGDMCDCQFLRDPADPQAAPEDVQCPANTLNQEQQG